MCFQIYLAIYYSSYSDMYKKCYLYFSNAFPYVSNVQNINKSQNYFKMLEDIMKFCEQQSSISVYSCQYN